MASGNRRLMSAFTTAAHSLLDPLLASAEGVEGTWTQAADAVRSRCVCFFSITSCFVCL
jgi:hypothetical protein